MIASARTRSRDESRLGLGVSSRRPLQHLSSSNEVLTLLYSHRYNQVVGRIRHLALRLSALPPNDPFRTEREGALLAKLYDMGLLDTGAKMSDVLEKLTVSSFARRRLPVVLMRLKMSESVKQVSGWQSRGAGGRRAEE